MKPWSRRHLPARGCGGSAAHRSPGPAKARRAAVAASVLRVTGSANTTWLDANINGTLYFWTHSTPLTFQQSTGDNSYSASDYAMYTLGTGGIKANPEGKEPSQYISSCQGFFVEGLKKGVLTFKNEMRTVEHNDNFFKSNNT